MLNLLISCNFCDLVVSFMFFVILVCEFNNFVCEVFFGLFNCDIFVICIDGLIDKLGQVWCFLIDLSDCDFELMAGEFMVVIDIWFE